MTRLLLVFLTLLAGVAPIAAQLSLVDRTYDAKTGTRCEVTALVSELPTSGYMPVRITLRNGGKIDRTWFFRFTSYDTGWADENNEMRSDFSMLVVPTRIGRPVACTRKTSSTTAPYFSLSER